MTKIFTYGTNAQECFTRLEKELEATFGDHSFQVVKKDDVYYIEFMKDNSPLYTKIKVVRSGGGSGFSNPWYNMSVKFNA